jgi:enterobactin synthetase component D / holo-[acyl-carrier protein] synthase
MTVDIAFDLSLPHGRCVGVRLPELAAELDELEAELLPEERAVAASFGGFRRRSWIGGRLALRQALSRAEIDAPAVLSDARGAPRLPVGVAGSISHKKQWAVALVAREGVAKLGVDIENDVIGSVDISRRVLRPDERIELAPLEPEPRAREVLLRFSAKEAVYKALDPFVQRYVAFGEARVSPRADGGAHAELHLAAGEGPFSVEVRWLRIESFVLTTARVVRITA